MKIALVSDLHLEFAPVKLPPTEAEILLLAGDIVPIASLAERRTDADGRKVQKRVDAFIAESLSQYKQVFHILGNHEYYHGVWGTSVKEFQDYWSKKAPQVKVLNDEAVQLGDGLHLWGGTLWTDFSGGNPIFMEAARDGMNDYHQISHHLDISPKFYATRYIRLRPADTYEAHENSRYAIKEAVESAPETRWVVMTHHAPSWRSVLEKYKEDVLSYGFASHMDKFIEDHPQINAWVHGHTHSNFDYTVGKTRVLCNPRGYAHPNSPNKPENTSFNPNFVFEV